MAVKQDSRVLSLRSGCPFLPGRLSGQVCYSIDFVGFVQCRATSNFPPIIDSEPCKNVLNMKLYSSLGNSDFITNLLVGETFFN